MPGALSSTAQDLNRGRITEIDSLNGYLVRRAAAHGIPAPVNQTLFTLIKLLETAGPRYSIALLPGFQLRKLHGSAQANERKLRKKGVEQALVFEEASEASGSQYDRILLPKSLLRNQLDQ